MTNKLMKPVHPGEILLKELMQPYSISQNKLAQDLGVAPRRINEIVLGKRAITADTALRLARYFKMSADFWMGLQKDYDLETCRDKFADRVKKEVKVFRQKKPSNEARHYLKSA